MVINKIIRSVKEAISPEKKPRPSVEYFDQDPPKIYHSAWEQRAQQDSWLNPGGRRDFRGWLNR